MSGSTIPGMPFLLWPAQKNPQERSLSMMEGETTSPSTSSTRCTPPRCHKFALIPNLESLSLPTKQECWNTGPAFQVNSGSPRTCIGNIKQIQTCMNLQNTKPIPPVLRFLLMGRKWPPLHLTGKSESSAS